MKIVDAQVHIRSKTVVPNVAVKATGAPHYSTQPYPFRNIRDGLHRIFDAIGPKRMFWGTDITRMPCSYRQCVTLFTEELPWLSGSDLEDVMGRSLCEWIGWDASFSMVPRQRMHASKYCASKVCLFLSRSCPDRR